MFPAADNPTSQLAELRGECMNRAAMTARMIQWFGNTRLAWSGTVGELAAAIDVQEPDLAQALLQGFEELAALGISVSLRQPVGCARQVTLRRLQPPEQISAPETRLEVQQPVARESRCETDETVPADDQHDPMRQTAAAPGLALNSDLGGQDEPLRTPQHGTDAAEQEGPLAAAPMAVSAGDEVLDLLRANSQRWSEPNDSRLHRVPPAALIAVLVIVIGIASAYYAMAKRKVSVIPWARQFTHAAAANKASLQGTTPQFSAANAQPTSSNAGHVSDRDLLPQSAARKPSRIIVLRKRGVRLDLAEDMKGFGQAALSGDANAQFQLGAAYALGRGVPADAVTAYTWLTLAVANGKPQAESLLRELTREIDTPVIARIRWNLGQMYANGIGVPADKTTAYMWQLLAASAGDARSSSAQSQLAASMTPEQVYQAQLRATEWLNRHRQRSQRQF